MKMMIMARLLLCLLCFVALVYGQPNPDTATMISLRDSLKSENLNWSDPNPCLWTGLGCDTRSHRVTRIQIGNRGISGTLTSDLRNLSSLTVFDVMSNNLTGKIPRLAGLKSLEKLFVNDNGFTLIDSEDFFTGLSSLQFVNLDNNPLRPWTIPSSLTDSTSLAVFSASNCSLFGTIPDFHRRLTFPNLTALELSSNSLEGELPMSFAGSSVQILRLNGQKLNGSISVLTNMTDLTEVSLQENRLNVSRFNVSGNRLTGLVPSSLTWLPSLSDLALGNNLLQGPAPYLSARYVRFDKRGNNSFCLDSGYNCDMRVNTLIIIAQAFGFPVIFAESWKGNDPCNSMWLGVTCTGADITVINFKGMGLTGTISPYFARLQALKVINLSHNNITGTIPQELTTLKKLKALDVSYNKLSGIVPNFRRNVVDTSGSPDSKPALGSLGSSSRNNAGKIVAYVIGSVFSLILIGIAILCVKKQKPWHKMHPQQYSDDLKITIGEST